MSVDAAMVVLPFANFDPGPQAQARALDLDVNLNVSDGHDLAMRSSNQGDMPTELAKAIEKILAKGRVIQRAGQEDADKIDEMLFVYTSQKSLPYVRITLRDRQDLNEIKEPFLVKDGKIEYLQSPLKKILMGGGVILIDYNNSSPKLLEEFNSLFDPKPKLWGWEIPPGGKGQGPGCRGHQ